MKKIISKYGFNEVQLARILAFLLVSLSLATQGFSQDTPTANYEPGKIRIKLKKDAAKMVQQRSVIDPIQFAGAGLDELDAVNNDVGITKVRRVFPFSPKFEAKHRKYGLDQWYELYFDPNIEPSVILKQYENLHDIEIAKPVIKKISLEGANRPVVYQSSDSELNNLVGIEEEDTLIFDDPFLKDQWHYQNDGRFGGEANDIDLFKAWQRNTGSPDIIVSVVDQGVDYNHEDLADNMWENAAEVNGLAGVDDDQNGYIDDFYGYNFIARGAITPGPHGTHVAGTVGAVNNNGLGVAGVAGGNGQGNGIKLMSCQVFDESTGGGQNFAEAIVYSADNGAIISQNSWGYAQPDYYEPEIVDAINYFIYEAGSFEGSPMTGGILFFAAGNTGTEMNKYPGAFDNVIGVTASGPTGLPAPFSTYGKWTDIAAPGGDMVIFGDRGGILSTLPGNSYGYMEGTSMACPHVSGVAALVVSKFGGPGFTAEELRRIVLNSAERFEFDHEDLYGKGHLNADRALLDNNRVPPNKIDDLRAIDIFHNEIRIAWTVPEDPDGNDPAFYYLTVEDEPVTANNFNNGPLYRLENNLVSGETFELRITGLLKNKEYWIAIKSVDLFENISEISNVLKVVTSNEPRFMASNRTINITLDAQDKLIEDVPITFSNIGEGIIYWNAVVNNEKYYRTLAEESFDASISISTESSLSSVQDTINSLGVAIQNVTQDLLAVNGFEIRGEHWQNDVTEYVAGLSYDNGTYPSKLAGSRNENAGFVMATRFDIPRDYSFNLTHIEAVLLPEVNEYPIRIEIKKGGRNNFEESETVYEQEYYPDTVNQLKYYRIPIYRPQRFEDGETFWVVLHFPKEMAYPLALQSGEYQWGHFLMSSDNGRTYTELVNYLFRYLIPMVSVYSTGDDGSYVFLDPTTGEIPQAQSNNVNVTIDGKSLSNGQHLASLGIITNDINKPIVNIEVMVNVINQLPELYSQDQQDFNAFAQRPNPLALSIQNIGLGELEIYNSSSNDDGFTHSFEDTLRIKPDEFGEVPFIFQPETTGIHTSTVVLHTNIGDLIMPIKIFAEAEPELEMSLFTNNVVMPWNTTDEVFLKIKNVGTGAPLTFDLSDYSIIKSTAGVLPSKLSYKISSSNDIDGPRANQWEDISGFGIKLTGTEAKRVVELDMKFPYFNQVIGNIRISNLGRLIPFNDGYITPLRIEGKAVVIDELYYYNFGDRSVFSFTCNVTGFTGTGNNVLGKLEYQVVLFRDGLIEFRYKNVDYLSTGEDYSIWLDGIEYPEKINYREFGETSISIENGTVLRFAPERDVSIIEYIAPLTGNILPGDSVVAKAVLNPLLFQQNAGLYENEIIVTTNTFDHKDTIRFQVEVTGEGSVEVQDSLAYGPLTVGITKTGFVRISNTGSDNLQLISAAANISEIETNIVSPVVISANSRFQLPVRLTPTSSGEITGLLNLTFDDATVVDVVISALSQPDLSYTHTFPDKLEFNLIGGETKSFDFNITNTTPELDLDYIFTNSVFAGVKNEVGYVSDSSHTFNYNYSWSVSDSAKIFHKWQDLSDQSMVLPVEADKQVAIALPFKFPYYEQEFDSIWISRNGYVTVKEPSGEPNYDYGFRPNDGLPGMIAPFWSDLKPSSVNGVMVKTEADRIYIQWTDFVGANSMLSSGKITVQLELVKDGGIYFHYKDIGSWGGLVKHGLESPDELSTLEDPKAIVVNYADFTDNSTISIRPPSLGRIGSAETSTFRYMVSAQNIFYPGTYNDTVRLTTNSKMQSVVNLPVTLNVTGVPSLSLADTLDWDEVVYRDGLSLQKTLLLTNVGYDIMIIDNIAGQNIANLDLYLSNGDKIIRNGTGTLLEPIVLEPWGSMTLEVQFTVEDKSDIDGNIQFNGNFDSQTVKILVKLVDSPVFSWNATDQEFNVNNTEKTTYSFTIENKGVSSLKYKLVPAVIPESSDSNSIQIIETVGNYTFDKPTTIDSLSIEKNEVGDGVFTPFVSGANLSFANRFTAPEGGLYLTHIKTYNYLNAIGQYVSIRIYFDGELPEEGDLVYDQNFVIDEPVDEEWIYFELEKPFLIPEGQMFYIAVAPPVAPRYMGYNVSNDIDVLQNCFSGVYQGNDQFYWYPGYTQSELMVWKIRPLTAAGSAQWLELDHLTGELIAGESREVNAAIIADNLKQGVYSAKVQASSNDLNLPKVEFNLDIMVNGAPVFDYHPNIYEDTLKVFEDEEIVYNYLFSDPENENILIQMNSPLEGPEANFEQLSNSTAQLRISTDYDDNGFYKYAIRMLDESGNVVHDTVMLEVLDKNRPPILNPEYISISINLADSMPSLVINPGDLFSDPDGDVFEVFAGNYSPDVVDLTFGTSFLSLIPIKEGTAQVVFAADDGRDDGFVAHLVYVSIINDPNAVLTSTSSDELELTDVNRISLYPNPIEHKTANIAYRLKEMAKVNIQLFSNSGQTVYIKEFPLSGPGDYRHIIELNTVRPGLYFCHIKINDELRKSVKVIIK